jgi:hypothetical protein
MQLQPEATNLADRAPDATGGRKLTVEFNPESGGEASVGRQSGAQMTSDTETYRKQAEVA